MTRRLGTVVHAYNPSTQEYRGECEADLADKVQGKPELHSETMFQKE